MRKEDCFDAGERLSRMDRYVDESSVILDLTPKQYLLYMGGILLSKAFALPVGVEYNDAFLDKSKGESIGKERGD
ncbi:MAG: hypothetical protein KJ718_03345 [Nanoarchaeota archaeon]|nr:hypothetical protein [Nanoarchaeota archaeon]MBU1051564.1 hypothetical protein [Nanoarchaeota archaeon]